MGKIMCKLIVIFIYSLVKRWIDSYEERKFTKELPGDFPMDESVLVR